MNESVTILEASPLPLGSVCWKLRRRWYNAENCVCCHLASLFSHLTLMGVSSVGRWHFCFTLSDRNRNRWLSEWDVGSAEECGRLGIRSGWFEERKL